jgi:FkbM family methyltransferase
LNDFTQLTVLPLALGNARSLELDTLPLVRGMVDSTLKAQYGNGHNWQEPLLVVGLDQVWAALCDNDPRIHGVKLDVQGMELAVLQGMSRVLRTYHPKLVVEVHHGVSRPDLLALIQEMGYSPAALPIEPEPGETTAQFVNDKSYAFVPERL